MDKWKCIIYRDAKSGSWGTGETKLEAKENAKKKMLAHFGNYIISEIVFEEIEGSEQNEKG